MDSRYPSWILERGFGGMGAAVSPISKNSIDKWPDGLSSPCSREACIALVQACNNSSSPADPRCIVLLVGGAGNGKSKLAADTVAQIDGTLEGERSQFARRKYCFRLRSGTYLRVLNDATIPPDDQYPAPLLRDISEALQGHEHLLVCVNRGVLISEAGSQVDEDAGGELLVAKSLANWLLTGEGPEVQDGHLRVEFSEEKGQAPGNYGYAKILKGGSHLATVHAVYMDQASLLENWPVSDETPGDPFEPLKANGSRAVPLLSKERTSMPSAFEACLRKATEAFAAELPVGDLDPVSANARSMQGELSARGWCSVMRGAEVISGSQFTYRELWALVAHSLVGPSTPGELGVLATNIEEWIGIAESDRDEALEALVALGNMRTHMLLFDAGNPNSGKPPTRFRYPWPNTSSEALRSLALADPLRQLGPSNGKAYLELADRLSRIEDKVLPVAGLAREDPAVGQYWTKLDERIELKIAEAVNPENDHSSLNARNELLGWYGRYMYRLVAFSRGWPAHCSVVHTWQNAWVDAQAGRPFRRDLEDAILNIVAPLENPNAEAYFTFMKPSVVGNSTAQSVAEIEVPRNRMRISAEALGDRIEITIDPGATRDGKKLQTRTSLDFHLLREAQSRVHGQGFTDSLELIEPRIERLRASLVASGLAARDGEHRYRFSKLGMGTVTR